MSHTSSCDNVVTVVAEDDDTVRTHTTTSTDRVFIQDRPMPWTTAVQEEQTLADTLR